MAAFLSRLTDRDIDFIVQYAAPDFRDKAKLRQLIIDDEDFRRGLTNDERLFERVMADKEILLRISPALYFEILLKKAFRELETASHTIERTGRQAIPVFDAREVVEFLAGRKVLDYLADMLSSFTRVQSFTIPVRLRKGVWRKIRFNDMDIDSLSRMCDAVDDETRFQFYKRIGDVCLFVLGIFPEHAYFDYRYPSGEVRAGIPGRFRKGMEEYEEEGRKFYRLAAEHEFARVVRMSEVLWLLHENFNTAKKPMNFISDNYLNYRKQELFG